MRRFPCFDAPGQPDRRGRRFAVDAFSWHTLTSRPADAGSLDALGGASLVVFAFVFLGVSALMLWPRRFGLRRRLGRDATARWLVAGLWLSSLGLIFLILRLLRIDPITLGRPIWLAVVLLGIACWLLWLIVALAHATDAVEERPNQVYRRPKKGGSYR